MYIRTYNVRLYAETHVHSVNKTKSITNARTVIGPLSPARSIHVPSLQNPVLNIVEELVVLITRNQESSLHISATRPATLTDSPLLFQTFQENARQHLQSAKTATFHILSNSSFTSEPIIRHSLILFMKDNVK